MKRLIVLLALSSAFLLTGAAFAPESGEYVYDLAGILSENDADMIRQASGGTDQYFQMSEGRTAPLIVLTVPEDGSLDRKTALSQIAASQFEESVVVLVADSGHAEIISTDPTFNAAELNSVLAEYDAQDNAAYGVHIANSYRTLVVSYYANAGYTTVPETVYQYIQPNPEGDTKSYVYLGLTFALLILVIYRFIRINQKIRKRFGNNRSYYTRKDFSTTPKAFDEDGKTDIIDID